jgi:hypothetical protein
VKRILSVYALWTFMVVAVLSVKAGEPERYTLRYRFHPGETIRWEVEHRSMVRATVSGSTQTTDNLSKSMKTWRVTDVRPDGTATFEHQVDWVDMRQKLTGRDEVHYDSRTDARPPVGFQDVAKSVGVPLSIVSIDAHGKLLRRKSVKQQPAATPDKPEDAGWMTIPLPDGPVPVGYAWSIPQDIDVPLPNGTVKKVKAMQQFVLEEVKTGVATIRVSTDILTPVTDPAIESQLVQRETAGRVRFDIDAGRIIAQQMDIDKHVVGFRGEASSIHYVNRFSERLVEKNGG